MGEYEIQNENENRASKNVYITIRKKIVLNPLPNNLLTVYFYDLKQDRLQY